MEFEIYKMLYKIVNSNLRILGNIFVKNNKHKGKLIINNKKEKISEFINIMSKKDENIKIKILLVKNVKNKSCFFKDCIDLLKLSTCSIEKKINQSRIYSSEALYFRHSFGKFVGEWVLSTSKEIEESLFDNINISVKKYITFYDDSPKDSYIDISEISETEKKSGIISPKINKKFISI